MPTFGYESVRRAPNFRMGDALPNYAECRTDSRYNQSPVSVCQQFADVPSDDCFGVG